MQRTRRAILDFLKERRQATLEDLSQHLGLCSMTVRGHLSVLERDGLVSFQEERGKVGRPRFVFSLTERAQDEFPKSYHVLCNRILDALAASPALPGSSFLVEQIARRWAEDHANRVEGQRFDEQVQTLAEIRSEEGAMASCEQTADGDYLIEQHHCPASCVASRHPEIVCAAEIGFMRRLLNAPIERVSWIQRGDATCTYRIRRPASPPASPPRPSTSGPAAF